MHSGEQTIHKYLIQRSQKGDRSAQGELYKLYVNAMYNICRRMVGDDEVAKDVLQDAFIQAFTHLNRLKNINTFSAWLKRIVVNTCINHINKKRLLTAELSDNVEVMEDAAPDEHFDQHEIEQILHAIDHISEGCRVVLNLYLFEGYDHQEISQILNISTSASKAQYSKAKAKIRKLLQDERG